MRFLLLLLVTPILFAQPSPQLDNRWAPLTFLIGEWTGEGGGGPGQGSVSFSFLPDQDGKILVRKNRADYPASKDRPAFSHTDLMVVYKEKGGAKLGDIYYNIETQVLRSSI